ncbi:hypothetical protein [Methylobacterium frigidaeris]|uniref:Uncharacterized protein n=1 Tax=Methylobacterium frigidaeris TaxID=2038277 RepID=A0AA37HEL2_9HYPH|nr:hypothetical protein [Methylobacterium frigidaeris]GJD64318.1 hypothetical protein MPEAHAMD_4499 [Methylobacterium frigidaeris]
MSFTSARRTAMTCLTGGMSLAMAGVLNSSVALAQPLMVRVNPYLADQGVLMSGNQTGSVQTLFYAGPRYTGANGRGARVGIGSSIPDWVQIGSFQNVSVQGLNPVGYYGYFISPDDKAVIVDLGSRRIVRVIRP